MGESSAFVKLDQWDYYLFALERFKLLITRIGQFVYPRSVVCVSERFSKCLVFVGLSNKATQKTLEGRKPRRARAVNICHFGQTHVTLAKSSQHNSRMAPLLLTLASTLHYFIRILNFPVAHINVCNLKSYWFVYVFMYLINAYSWTFFVYNVNIYSTNIHLQIVCNFSKRNKIKISWRINQGKRYICEEINLNSCGESEDHPWIE